MSRAATHRRSVIYAGDQPLNPDAYIDRAESLKVHATEPPKEVTV